MFSQLIVLFSIVLCRAAASQKFFSHPPSYGVPLDAELFTPVEDLSAISPAEYTTLSHPAFPAHSVRIKQITWCDDTVRAYTGYVDVQARHLFFYFFESRNNPKTDDVILWTNGGPGCSSSLGLLMELGPCQIKDATGPKFNPHSWNSQANVFFIDQPIGVGFSYADYGETVTTTEDAAKDIASFVQIFFEHFTDFKGRAFHLAGESYGGHYLPIFAGEIYDQNTKIVAAGLTPVNLTSVIIGNGITDSARMVPSYYDIQCTGASVNPFQDISTCVRMKQALPRCEQFLKESCVDEFDAMSCGAAKLFCGAELSTPFFNTNKNPYDVSKDCEGKISETLCYPVTLDIVDYLNKPEIRKLLNVDSASTMDEVHPGTPFYVAQLLERGVKVLIYVGTYDWICNWIGNQRFTLALEWSGQKSFVAQALREWKVDGKPAGLTRSADGFTFATIQGAGHMVPHDKPVEALTLLNRWLGGQVL